MDAETKTLPDAKAVREAAEPSELETVRGFRWLASLLRKQITSGELAPGSRLKSIRKLAEDECISIAAVCKAIDILVSEGRLRKVEREGIFVAPKVDLNQRTRHIGLLTPFAISQIGEDPLIKETVQAIQQKIGAAGKNLSAHQFRWKPRPDVMWSYVPADEIRTYGVSGAILYGLYDSHYLSALSRLQIPMVALDTDAVVYGLDSVCFGNTGAAFELTRLLLQRGHRNIIYVGGPLPPPYCRDDGVFDPSTLQRADGYEVAMRTLAPEFPCRTFFNPGRRQTSEWIQTARAALAKHPECTALLSEPLLNPQELGAANVETAGFIPSSSTQIPAGVVAVAECDYARMGAAAAELLLERLADPERPVQRRTIHAALRQIKPAGTAGPVDKG